MERRKLVYDSKLIVMIWLVIAFVLFYHSSRVETEIASASGGYDLDQPLKEQKSNATGLPLYFENDSVEVGVPLIVSGAPKDATYRWTITAADGTSNTYKTTENSYIPVEADIETLITVTVEGSEESASIYCSQLPVIYISYSEGYYGVGDEYDSGIMRMQGNNRYNNPEELYQGDIEIRLRGNSTRWREKKPFNIKLDKKADLLGMGKNKRWALLANDIDHTLMRNKLIYDFSGAIGMDTYSKSENVVVVFNNEYNGVYQLCETVNIGPERVEIYDWEESAEKTAEAIVDELLQQKKLTKGRAKTVEGELEDAMCEDMSWITSPYTFSYDLDEDGTKERFIITDYIELPAATGGVLLEMDFYAFDGHNPSTMITAYSLPIYVKTPEYARTNTELFDYTQRYVQAFEHALHSTDFIYHENKIKYRSLSQMGGHKELGYIASNFTAPEYDGKHYSELFDMDSLVEYFLVAELSMNWDSMKNSVFLYKDIDGLFHMGPAWDYDWAWGNINMYNINTWYPTSWHTTEEAFTVEQYYQKVQWNRSLIRDPYFLSKVYEKYKEIRGTVIEDMIKQGGTIDAYTQELSLPAMANDLKWSYTYRSYRSVGFMDSIINMKKFLELRINFMDEQFATLDRFIASLGAYQPSDELQVIKVTMLPDQEHALVKAKVFNTEIASIALQLNGSHIYEGTVKDGQVELEVSIYDLMDQPDKLNVIQIMAKDSTGEYIITSMEKGNYYNALSNYYVFKTDEPIIARIKEANSNIGSTASDAVAAMGDNVGDDKDELGNPTTQSEDGQGEERKDNSSSGDETIDPTGDQNSESEEDTAKQRDKDEFIRYLIIFLALTAGVIILGTGFYIKKKPRKVK